VVIYDKPALSLEEQADKLIARGLVADRSVLLQRLASVNYYRLSGYLHTYRQKGPEGQPLDVFRPGTRFDDVWDRYRFDRQLRLLVLDAIERFEVSFKTQLTLNFSRNYDPFGYLDTKNLPRCNASDFAVLLKKMADEASRSKEEFVVHFRRKYGDSHPFLPLWMAVEIMSFGTVLALVEGMKEADLKTVARHYGVPLPVLTSWLRTLNTIRNVCAHHSRLWNRELGVKPTLPRYEAGSPWHDPVPMTNNRVFAVLTILKFLMSQIAPQSGWPARLHILRDSFPSIPRAFMGFPENWQRHGVWNP
jgi:abortive infection bacteriophage resistance protein